MDVDSTAPGVVSMDGTTMELDLPDRVGPSTMVDLLDGVHTGSLELWPSDIRPRYTELCGIPIMAMKAA